MIFAFLEASHPPRGSDYVGRGTESFNSTTDHDFVELGPVSTEQQHVILGQAPSGRLVAIWGIDIWT